MANFRCILYLFILIIYSAQSMAEDPMIEKQRHFQKERFAAFNKINRSFDFDDKKTQHNLKKSDTTPPIPLIDSVAFPNGIRDPFAVPSILLESLASERNKKEQMLSSSTYAFSNTSLLKMPKIKLKGVVHRKGSSEPLAIVLLNNESYMVREGDELGFNPSEPSKIIKIKKIRRLSVLVEVGTLGALVIVR